MFSFSLSERPLAAVFLYGALSPVLACNPTFAPPVRATHYGAPGRLQAGQLEIGGTAGGINTPTAGGPHVGYAIRDWVAIEGGSNLSLISDQQNWAMGYVGPRFTYTPHRGQPNRLILDFELGVGAGVGGVIKGNECAGSAMKAGSSQGNPMACPASMPSSATVSPIWDGRQWNDRFAYGSYQGVGLGGRFHFFSLFVRARLEESAAQGVPPTLWPSMMSGIEFDVYHGFIVGGSIGYLGYWNQVESNGGLAYQVSVAALFNLL